MNFLIGLVILIVIFAPAKAFITPVISDFMDGFPYESEAGLLPGDRLVSIDGEKIYTYSDVSVLFARSNGETMDLVIQRDGKLIERSNFPLVLREYVLDGQTQMKYGLIFTVEPATIPMRLQTSWYSAVDFVRLVRLGLGDLISGAASGRDLTGPVGGVGYISEVGSQSADTASAITNVLHFSALIAVNLAVMNMLPLPALDGGRIFFLFVNALYTLLFRRKMDPKYEGYVHAAGLICLLLLMAAVTFSDIAKLVTGT
jgi:regulator of sigma E protease